MFCTRLTLWDPRKIWSLDKFRGDVSVGKNPIFRVSSIWQCVNDPKVRVTVLHMGDFFIQGTKLRNIRGETFWHLESSLGTEDRIRYWHSSEELSVWPWGKHGTKLSQSRLSVHRTYCSGANVFVILCLVKTNWGEAHAKPFHSLSWLPGIKVVQPFSNGLLNKQQLSRYGKPGNLLQVYKLWIQLLGRFQHSCVHMQVQHVGGGGTGMMNLRLNRKRTALCYIV